MRLFFALPLAPEDKLAIDEWRLRMFPRDIKAIPSENYHVTLSFIGNCSSKQLDSLCSASDHWLAHDAPERFCLTIDQSQYWSGSGILWVGPSSWPESLTRLHAKLGHIARQCTSAKKPKRSFQPHVSLYRSKSPIPKPLMAPYFELRDEEVTLFESVQGTNAVSYRELKTWPLVQNAFGRNRSNPQTSAVKPS